MQSNFTFNNYQQYCFINQTPNEQKLMHIFMKLFSGLNNWTKPLIQLVKIRFTTRHSENGETCNMVIYLLAWNTNKADNVWGKKYIMLYVSRITYTNTMSLKEKLLIMPLHDVTYYTNECIWLQGLVTNKNYNILRKLKNLSRIEIS
jgi:hypothetical protein